MELYCEKCGTNTEFAANVDTHIFECSECESAYIPQTRARRRQMARFQKAYIRRNIRAFRRFAKANEYADKIKALLERTKKQSVTE